MARLRKRVKRTRQGTYRVDLPAAERDVLRRLLPQLRALVASRAGGPLRPGGLLGELDEDGLASGARPAGEAGDGAGHEGEVVEEEVVDEEVVDDGRTRRLFPVAYAADARAEAEYQELMHDELVASRLAAIDTMERSLDAGVLDEEQLGAWMASVNSVRLVLGTVLDVSEELDLADLPADHPDLEAYALYGYLGYLLEELVQAALDR